MDAIVLDGDPKNIYSDSIRTQIANRVAWRPNTDPAAFFDDLEKLGRGFIVSRTKFEALGLDLHPRRAKEALMKASDAETGLRHALKVFDSAMEELEELQGSAGTVRQLMGGYGGWDALDDARHLIVEFGDAATAAVERFRAEMGTSPQQVDPVRAWAWLMWLQYRKYDQKPSIGRRASTGDEPGRFEGILESLAEPLRIRINWRTIERHLREIAKEEKASATKPGTKFPSKLD